MEDDDEDVKAAAPDVEAAKCSCVSISDKAVSNCSCLIEGIKGKKSFLLRLDNSSNSMIAGVYFIELNSGYKDNLCGENKQKTKMIWVISPAGF